METALLGIVGFSAGFIVACGEVALIVGLGIITRFAGITHTAKHIRLYEDAILLGAVTGTVLTVYQLNIPIGAWILLPVGLFFGIFVGGWIMALAEIINVFPVFGRRLGMTKGLSWIVISIAAGKVLGALVHFQI